VASIRTRTSKAGVTTWQVLWREGGRQPSATFVDQGVAEKFRDLVPVLGEVKALAALGEQRVDPNVMTVDKLAARFLEWKARDVTQRTLADYRRDYDNWIKPFLGHRPADAVDETDVQNLVDHMARTLSPKSVADRHMILHSMYQYGRAKSRRLVTHNPCLETELPKRTRKPPKGMTTPEWRAMIEVAHVRNAPDAADLILFLGSLGWRWSEAAALAVGDIEDDGTHVWVDVTRVFRIVDNRQVLVEEAAKSYAGFRRSRVPSEAAAMFRRRVVGKGPGDYVFTNRRGTHWNQNTFLRDTWPTIRDAAGVTRLVSGRRVTPHHLRHMAVANMARAGIPMHEIQRIIGHEDIKTTNSLYGGTVSTLSADAVMRLDRVLEDRPSDAIVVGEVL
jgi:integrase